MEFGLRKIPFRQQPPFDVVYKGQKVGLFVPDLVAFDSVVVALRVKTNSGGRVWLGGHAGDGASESLRGEGRNLPPLPTCFRRRKFGGYLASVRVLFDQGTPVPLRNYLGTHKVARALEMGWAGLGWLGSGCAVR